MNFTEKKGGAISFDFNNPQWRTLSALMKKEVAAQNKEKRNPVIFTLNIVANLASKREDFLMMTKYMDDSIKKLVMRNQTIKYIVQPEIRSGILKNLKIKVVISPVDETLEREHKLLLKICKEEVIPQLKKIYSTINFKFECIFNAIDTTRYVPHANMARIVYLVYNRRQRSDISQKDMEKLFQNIKRKNPKINFSYIYNNFEADKDYMILNFQRSFSIKTQKNYNSTTTFHSPIVHKNGNTVKIDQTVTKKSISEKTTSVPTFSEEIKKITTDDSDHSTHPDNITLPSNGYDTHITIQGSTENMNKNTENMKGCLCTKLETSFEKVSMSATTDDMIFTKNNALTTSISTKFTDDSNYIVNKENTTDTENEMSSSNGYDIQTAPQELASGTTGTTITKTSATISSENQLNSQLTKSLPTSFVSSNDSKNIAVSRSYLHKSLTSIMGKAGKTEMANSEQLLGKIIFNTASKASNELPETWLQMIKNLFNSLL